MALPLRHDLVANLVAHAEDQDTWRSFHASFRPLIRRWLHGRACGDSAYDADDIAQEVMMLFWSMIRLNRIDCDRGIKGDRHRV